MRRLVVCILLLSLVTVPARSVEKPKLVALTFDDGPSEYTNRLLDILLHIYEIKQMQFRL